MPDEAHRESELPLQQAIRLAIKSFKDCPVPIDHPSNAVELKHVGPVVSQRIRWFVERLPAVCLTDTLYT